MLLELVVHKVLAGEVHKDCLSLIHIIMVHFRAARRSISSRYPQVRLL